MNFCPECGSRLQDTLVDGEVRKACSGESCNYVLWNNPVPVVAVIVEVDKDGESGVVMAHNVSWPPNFYSVITGFLEAGEKPEDCASRETLEELGLHVTESSLVGCYAFPQQNQVIMAYHVKAQGEIVLNHELDDYRLVSKEKIKVWPMGTGLALADWLRGQGIEPEVLEMPGR